MIHNKIFCKLFCILFVFGIISNISCFIQDFVLSPSTKSGNYNLGQNINISCTVNTQTGAVVIGWDNKGVRTFIAENGRLYSKYRQYKYVTVNITKTIRKHIIIIDHLQIDNNRTWICMDGNIEEFVKINIKVIGELKNLLVERIESKNEERLIKKFSNLLFGRGTRTNPYDLLRNRTVRITCTSSCSTLKVGHIWQYRNLSSVKPPIKFHSPIPIQYEPCKFIKNGDGQLATSFVDVDCRRLQLVGSNEVSCHSDPLPTSDITDKFKSVYVLCPGGHQIWRLTNAEIIGIFVAVTLCCVVIIVLFLSARQIVSGGGSHNHGRYSTSIQGIRV